MSKDNIIKEKKQRTSIGKDKKVKKEKKEKKEKKSKDSVEKTSKKRKLEEVIEEPTKTLTPPTPDFNKKRKISDEKYVIVSGEEGKERIPIQNFDLHQETIKGLEKEGFNELFAVQSKTFEYIIEGRDVLVKARTGSGKTLAFAIPSIEKLRRSGQSTKFGRTPRVIVLVPTRELAVQVAKVFEGIAGNFSVCLLYGGVPYDPQENILRKGCDVVVGTPGRIIDHLERKNLNLSTIQFAILDEADEMLNFGFQEPIEKVLGMVTQPHQTLLFSATVPTWVKDIARQHLNPNYVTVDFIGQELTQTSTSLKHLAIFCEPRVRLTTLADVIRMYTSETGKTLVFANTKAEANEIAISSSISKESEVLHGDIAQKQREITLKGFRTSKFKTLIATDVAARGLDIDDIELVIQLQPPRDHETYIHRSGRTARAGKLGTCITFFPPWGERDLRFLETKAGIKFERIGTPQAEELIDTAAEGAVKKINEVAEEMIPFFESYAKTLIDQYGDVKALAAALALISGHSQPQKARSLLTSVEGYTTVLVISQRPIFSPKFICDVLSNHFDETVIKQIKDISLCDGGAVFDMPCDMAKKLVEMTDVHSTISFDICKKLPQLKERSNDRNNGRRSSFGSGGGGGGGWNRDGGQRNSFGGRNGGSSNGRGYGGGGGGYGGKSFGGGGGGRFGNSKY